MQIVFTLCFKCVDKPFLTLTDWHCLFIVGNGQAGVICNDQVKDGAVAKPVPVFKAMDIDKEITSVQKTTKTTLKKKVRTWMINWI